MKLKALFISLILSTSAFAKPAETVRKAMFSSAKVEVGDIVSGSAVAVQNDDEGTLFLSNDHVCQWSRGPGLLGRNPNYNGDLNTLPVTLLLADGRTLQAKVVYVSNVTNTKKKAAAQDDLCLIRVEEKIPAVTLSKQDVSTGEEVFSVSAPHGWFPHIAGGYTGGYYSDSKGQYVGSASLVIGEGSSGGGVFSKENGELIGIAFAIEAASEKVPAPLFALFVPVSRATKFIELYKQSVKDTK